MSEARIGFVTSGGEQSHIERSWRSTSSVTSLPTASFTIARAASAEMFPLPSASYLAISRAATIS